MNSVLKSKGRDISEESEEEPEVLENNFLARGESVHAMRAMFCHYTRLRYRRKESCVSWGRTTSLSVQGKLVPGTTI